MSLPPATLLNALQRYPPGAVGVVPDSGGGGVSAGLRRGLRSVWLTLVHWASTAGLFVYLFFTHAPSLRTAATPLSIAESIATPAATRWPSPLDCVCVANSKASIFAFRSARKSAGSSWAMNWADKGSASARKARAVLIIV